MKELIVLSEEDLIYCYEEGVRIKLYKRLPTKSDDFKELKFYQKNGGYDPSERRVSIYLPNITKFSEYKITLFHELAHAVDDLLFDDKYPEEEIEEIAQKTYLTNVSLFEFIKEMYKLPETKFDNERKKK